MDFKFQLVFLGVFLTLCMGEIVEVDEITDDNGNVIPVALEMNDDCSYRRYTSIFGDNVHVIVDDISNGISLIILSENTDACYVRTLTAEEKAKDGKCDNGTLLRQEGAPSQEKKRFSIGEEIDFGTLPSRAQELCQGRKALALKDLSEDQPQDAPNEKRSCRTELVTDGEVKCKHACQGLWRSRKCGLKCTEFNYPKQVC